MTRIFSGIKLAIIKILSKKYYRLSDGDINKKKKEFKEHLKHPLKKEEIAKYL